MFASKQTLAKVPLRHLVPLLGVVLAVRSQNARWGDGLTFDAGPGPCFWLHVAKIRPQEAAAVFRYEILKAVSVLPSPIGPEAAPRPIPMAPC